MNKILHPNKQKDAEADLLAAAAAAEAAAKEKEDLCKSYEKEIARLQDEVNQARNVSQGLVMVARMSSEHFLAMTEQEKEIWSLDDLKNIAVALYNRLKAVRLKDAKHSTTAQRLFGYLMADENARKNGVVQVIRNLHDELTQAESEQGLPAEIGSDSGDEQDGEEQHDGEEPIQKTGLLSNKSDSSSSSHTR